MNTILWILGIIIGAVVAGSILHDIGYGRGYDDGVKHERKRINTCLDSILTFEDRRTEFLSCEAPSDVTCEECVVTREEREGTSEEREEREEEREERRDDTE